MHHIDRVVFTFCCFILFVAVCTALYGFWTNPDNLPPALAAAIHATSPPTVLAKTKYTEEYRKNTNISTGKKNKYLLSLPVNLNFRQPHCRRCWPKTQIYRRDISLAPFPGFCEKNVSSAFFPSKTQILASDEHWQLQKATDPLWECGAIHI